MIDPGLWSGWHPFSPGLRAPSCSSRDRSSLGLRISLLTGLLQADSASPTCDSPTCRSFFGLFLRRHHCRHCGHVFCASHTPYLVPLDQHARFHPDGVPSRACDQCYRAYLRWDQARLERLSVIQSQLDAQMERNSNASTPTLVSDASDLSRDDGSRCPLSQSLGGQSDIAASVPRDWNWSTF